VKVSFHSGQVGFDYGIFHLEFLFLTEFYAEGAFRSNCTSNGRNDTLTTRAGPFVIAPLTSRISTLPPALVLARPGGCGWALLLKSKSILSLSAFNALSMMNFFTFGEVFDNEEKIAEFIGRDAGAVEDPIGVDAALDFPLFSESISRRCPPRLSVWQQRRPVIKDLAASRHRLCIDTSLCRTVALAESKFPFLSSPLMTLQTAGEAALFTKHPNAATMSRP
jgi:hypothetical protein